MPGQLVAPNVTQEATIAPMSSNSHPLRIIKLGMESSNGSAVAREEQDDGGGGAEERLGCQAVPHPRPKNEEGPRAGGSGAGPAGDTEEWCDGEARPPPGPTASGHGWQTRPWRGSL
ncbi:UNVERIFIED_CONTAM: hypothetical protein K2H54_015671 [Gekko kuhli]